MALPSALSIAETDEAGETRLATSSFGVKDLQTFSPPSSASLVLAFMFSLIVRIVHL